MDWFERITGFPEGPYEETQAELSVVDGRLRRHGAGYSYGVGTLSLPSLAELRSQALVARRSGPLRLSIAEGEVRALHRRPENRGTLVQVASQFNLLEMVGPDISPEDGVARYAGDPTQGPACAMAAGGGDNLPQLPRVSRGRVRADGEPADRRAGRPRRRAGEAARRASARPLRDAQRLRVANPRRAGGDRCVPRGGRRGDAGRAAGPAAGGAACRRRGDRRPRAGPAGLAAVLLGPAGGLRPTAGGGVVPVRAAGAGGGLRGDAAGRGAERGTRGLEPGAAHAAGRGARSATRTRGSTRR